MDIVKGVIPVLVLSSLSLTTISGFRSGSLGVKQYCPQVFIQAAKTINLSNAETASIVYR